MKKQKLILLFIFLILLISPFFWFGKDSLDVGGDDNRLFFLSPENYVYNFSLYCWNSYNALSNEYTPWYGFPFILIPYLLKKIGLSLGYRQMLLYGITLALGFSACYLFIRELLKMCAVEKDRRGISALIGALIYVFSPIALIVDWQGRMPQIYGIFTYPFLLYFFVVALNKRKIFYLAIGAFIATIFSNTIYMSVPWFAGFFIGAFVFLTGLFMLSREKARFLKYLFIYACFCFVLNLHWILILIDTLFLSQTAVLTYGKAFQSCSVSEFMHNVQFMNVLYPLLILPSKEFYMAVGSIFNKILPYKYCFILLIYPFVLVWGLIKAKAEARKILLISVFTVLVLLFFITVNITDFGVQLFAYLIKNVFGFVMFKNFQTKFSIAFSFFYAVAIGLSLNLVLQQNLRGGFKKVILFFLLLPLISPAKTLLSGMLVGVSPGILFHERLCAQIPQSHLDAMDVIKKNENIDRVFIFPSARYLFMATKCDNQTYYIGMPYIKPITQKESFEGMLSFRSPNYPWMPDIVYEILNDYDYKDFYKICWLLNINSVYLYDNAAPESAQLFLFKYNYLGYMKGRLLETLKNNKIGDFEDVHLYSIPYKQPPSHIFAKASITKTDTEEWLSKLVYTDYLSSHKKPLIAF